MADAKAAGVQGAQPDRVAGAKLTRWLSNPFVKKALRSQDLQKLTDRLTGLEGFLAAYPTMTGKYVVQWDGPVPAGVPTTSGAGRTIKHVGNAEIKTLKARATKAAKPMSLEEFEEDFAGPQGPLAPDIVQGVGPGGAIQMQSKAATGSLSTFICSASYLFQDPATGTYYLGTAGHCLLDEGVESSVEHPEARSRYVDVCVSDCINNWVGLGNYVRLEPSAGYHPVAWALQQGPGVDFGFIELPDSLGEVLRPWMWFWGGPTGFQRPLTGDPLAHYGFGITAGQAFPTQGRLGVTLLSDKATGVAAAGWVNGGDSGSAFGTAFPRTDTLLFGDGGTGALTHSIVGVGLPLMWGTDMDFALDLAEPALGFRPHLVLEDGTTQQVGGTVVEPTGPQATITSPANGATLDAAETPTVEVQGTAAFPGIETGVVRYWTHLSACGSATARSWMDLTQGPVDGGDGCGSAAGPIGPVWEIAVGEITSIHASDPAPSQPLVLEDGRNVEATVVLSGFENCEVGSCVPSVVSDLSVRLTQGATLIGTQRITDEMVLGPHTPIEFSFAPEVDVIEAGEPLTFTFVVDHAMGPVFMHHGGPTGSHIDLPAAESPSTLVQLSVDDPNFAAPNLLPVEGLETWSAPWDISELAGEHTLYARAVHDGKAQTPPSGVTVNITRAVNFGISITSPVDGAEVGTDFVASGTTEGTSQQGSAARASISGDDSPSLKGGDYERGRLVVDSLVELTEPANHGPPAPEDSVGIGPGSTLLVNFHDPSDGGNYVGICTAAFVFRDPNTGKVYLGAAGHCFMGTTFTSTHGENTDWDINDTQRVRVCVSTCIGGASGLVSGALGVYPSATRDLGKLAYARQTGAGGDVGNDFGIVEIPPSLWSEIRTDMPVWNGPGTAENRAVQLGDVIVHYGNAIGLGEVMPTKGRFGIGRGSNASRWLANLASAQGDSGSAVNIATVDGTNFVEGMWAAGILTHIVPGSAAIAGTTVTRAVAMAQEAGIALDLIHDSAQLGAATPPGAPTGLTATAGNGEVELSWVAPPNGGAPIEGYTVRWGTAAGGPYPNAMTAIDPSATVTGLTNGTEYRFVVSANNSQGEGPNSEEVAATPTLVTTVPGAPVDLVALPGDGRVSLSWDPPTDNGGETVTGYTVKWGTTPGGPYPNTENVSGTTASVTGLTNGIAHYFVVSATNANGEGANSTEVQATPDVVVSPYTVQVRLTDGTSPLTEWTPVASYDGSAWSHGFEDVPAGAVTLEARLLEDGTEMATDAIDITVARVLTSLSLVPEATDAQGTFTDSASFTARLVGGEGSEPIGGADVVFELTGPGGSSSWSTVTDDDGTASTDITVDMTPGEYTLLARYAGDAQSDGSSDEMQFAVEREVTESVLAIQGKGAKRTLTATLTEDDGPRLGGHEIAFFADGTQIGTARTDHDGVANLTLPPQYRGGRFDFEARYAGNENFLGSIGHLQT